MTEKNFAFSEQCINIIILIGIIELLEKKKKLLNFFFNVFTFIEKFPNFVRKLNEMYKTYYTLICLDPNQSHNFEKLQNSKSY